MRTSSLLFLSFSLLTTLSVSGCSQSSKEKKIEAEVKELTNISSKTVNTPERVLLVTGKKHFSHRMYSIAKDTFESLRDTYPSGPYLEFSIIKIADCQFALNEFDASAKTFEDFINSYPTSPSIPYALLKGGKSFQLKNRGAGRDITSVEKAIQLYTKLLDNLPDSVYAETAKKLRFEAIKTLSEHNKFVSDYYAKLNEAEAAAERDKEADSKMQELAKMMTPLKLKLRRRTKIYDEYGVDTGREIDLGDTVLTPPALYTAGRVKLSSYSGGQSGRVLFRHNRSRQTHPLNNGLRSPDDTSLDASRASLATSEGSLEGEKLSILKVECNTGDRNNIFFYLSKSIDDTAMPRKYISINRSFSLQLPVNETNPNIFDCFENNDIELDTKGHLVIKSRGKQAEVMTLETPPRLLVVIK
jgi:outer membrane assembly lipoprotein YfiO